MRKRELSEHAQAAKMIRAELKAAFPGITFRVTSRSFSMGDDVSIRWTDGPPRKDVEAITNKYQDGWFNGMEDIYEYNRDDNGLPHAKYVMAEREMSPETRGRITAKIGREYRVDMTDDAACMAAFNEWPDTMVSREFAETSFVEPEHVESIADWETVAEGRYADGEL